MRWIAILFCLLAAGCPPVAPPPETAEVLFHRGAEELAAGREPESLAVLQNLHPDSRWAELGLALRRQTEERAELARKLRSVEGELDRCRLEGRHKEGELDRCRLEGRHKEGELTGVRQDLERLKQLLIEMEKRNR